MTSFKVAVLFSSELPLDRGIVLRVQRGAVLVVVGALEARSERRHRLLAARRLCARGVSERSGQHQTDLSGRPARRLLGGDEGEFRPGLEGADFRTAPVQPLNEASIKEKFAREDIGNLDVRHSRPTGWYCVCGFGAGGVVIGGG